MSNFKKGTRVIYKGDKAKIILLSSGSYHSFKIFVYDTGLRTWLTSSDIEIDQEYYRDKKLAKLLNG